MDASPVPLIHVACPKCGTRYQLPFDAIGPKGRMVTCAHCRQTWHAEGAAAPPPLPDPDQMFDEAAESELDRAFAEAEQERVALPDRIEAAERSGRPAGPSGTAQADPAPDAGSLGPVASSGKSPPVDAHADRRTRASFARRQAAIGRQLPLAKLRRGARWAVLSVLAALVAGGIAFRTEIVRELPALAGGYEALGLGVNVVGLEFHDVRTLTLTRGGVEIMQIDARVYSIAARSVVIPPIVVTLLDDEDNALYEWSIRPETRDLEPGELIDVSTQLSAPPSGASRVRLTFAQGEGRAASVTPSSTEAID